MSLLEQIHKGQRKRARRMLIYGTRAVGKSTLGKRFPRPIFVKTEDGVDDIDCESFPLCATFDDCYAQLRTLYDEPHDYQTCVIDSADWLERLIWARACVARNVKSIEEVPYGKGYDFATPYWTDIINGLDGLRNDRNMTIVFLAHYKVEKVKPPDCDTYDRYSPKLHKIASDILQEWCDEVLFATYKVNTTKISEGFNATRTQAYGSGERVLKTTERPTHLAKNRLNLPDEIPLPKDCFPPELAIAL